MARSRHRNGISLEYFDKLISDADKKKIRTVSVAWGIPFDELGYMKFMIYYEKNAYKMPWDDWIPSEGTYVQQARNYIHNTFLDDCKAPYLMMLDSDIIFPPKIVSKLMAHNKPIVGGWYRDKKASNHHPCVYDYVDETNGMSNWKHRNKPGEGLEQVDATGAGCWLMSRAVAELLGNDPYGHNIAGGEDMILCKKLMDLKIPLFVDWSINCAHAGVGLT